MTTDIKSLKARYLPDSEFSGYGDWLSIERNTDPPPPKNGWRLQMTGFRRLSASPFDSF